MRRRTYLPALLVATPGVLALGFVTPAGAAGSDNGVAKKSASQIVTAASGATGAAKSFTYGGKVTEGGTAITLKLSVNTSGDGQGTISENGQPIKLIKVGDTVYFKASKAFWTKNEGAGAAQLIGDRWLSVPSSSSDFTDFVGLLDATQITGQFSDVSGTTFTKGKTSTVNGQRVIAVSGKDSSGGGTVYVATTGKPYFIKVTSKGNTLTFSNYNKPVKPSVPPNPIDVSSLGGATTTTG